MFRQLWERWKVIAHKIGMFQSRVLLNIFYVAILAPFGLGVKLLADPLRLKRPPHSQWRQRERTPAPALDRARRQF
jgi:hypothetical protein